MTGPDPTERTPTAAAQRRRTPPPPDRRLRPPRHSPPAARRAAAARLGHAATGRAATAATRLAATAGRSRRQRLAHPRGHHPGHRGLVLRDPDARARPAGPRLGSALAGHPDRPRRAGSSTRSVAAWCADWTQGDGSATDRAWLADWRRRVATLYAEVRGMAANDPAIALAHWRAVRESLFRDHPQSPVPTAAPSDVPGRPLRPRPEPALRGRRSSRPRRRRPAPSRSSCPNSGADTLAFSRIGRVTIPFAVRPAAAVRVLDGRLRGRPLHPVPRRDQRHRDLRRRPLPGRCREERRPRRRSGRGHDDPGLQLRRSSRRAPSTRAGRARWRHPRTAWTSRSVRESACRTA